MSDSPGVPSQEGVPNVSTDVTVVAERQDGDAPMPIVGIGASAGGVDALRTFFAELPAESGMAFVAILHLSRDYESNLAGILQQETGMKVQAAEDGMEVHANHVYVIPPARRLRIEDGHLRLRETTERHDMATVDRFFRSLAADQGENAVGVVLSGTGTDGSVGLRTIKEEGGVTMVQEPGEAEHDHMPKSAMATGLADLVLPVAELAQTLVEYRDRSGVIQLPDTEEALDRDRRLVLEKIFTRLYTVTGHDFSNYRRSMVLRRLERRMQLRATEHLDDYLALLERDEGEVRTLYKNLLISVTSFFRDPTAFEALRETVIPDLFADKDADDEVRVWVPGCATGEEAYSIVMLLLEHADTLDDPPALQIFATDVDREAIDVGREGLYPMPITEDISPERLDRFFAPEDAHYRVKVPLREPIIFAAHDLLTDPPFSSIDLVSCRNLLRSLTDEMQEHVFRRLHYALNEEGVLFLGRSEQTEASSRLFSVVDSSHSILRARPRSEDGHLPSPVLAEQGSDLNAITSGRSPAETLPGAQAEDSSTSPTALHQQALLGQVASVLVDENNEIVHLTDPATQYLSFEGGAPAQDLLELVPKALRPELQTALYRAFERGECTEYTHLFMPTQGTDQPLAVFVEPVEGPAAQTYASVRFEERARAADEEADGEASDDGLAAFTRSEMKKKYRAAREALEMSTEQFHSANEQLQCRKEELQTSKEELQSANEELQTVNRELQAKIEEVKEEKSVLENLIAATEIASIFLGRDLIIQRFTPRAAELFDLQSIDTGRPVADVTKHLEYEDLIADAQRVLDTHDSIEREIHPYDDQWYLLRLRPYRTVEGAVEGVVLTLIDVTERRELERELVNATERVRREIGQDLHDVLSSDLAALAMRADNLRRKLENKGVEEADEVRTITEQARKSAEQARTLSHALVPVALQEEHLAAALDSLCGEQEELADLPCTFEGNRGESLPRNKETAMHLYRIAREALTNVRRHAEASHATVSLRRANDRLVMTIRDDGVGMPDDHDEAEGLGLRTMTYRANLIEATLSIEDADGGGTVVRCVLPLREARAD